MKKIISLMLAVGMLFSMVACGKSTDEKNAVEKEEITEKKENDTEDIDESNIPETEENDEAEETVAMETEEVEETEDTVATGEKEEESSKDIYEDFLKDAPGMAPSEYFATGAIFDISKMYRKDIKEIADSYDVATLLSFWSIVYVEFCESLKENEIALMMVDTNINDTNYAEWNADIITLESGEKMALCYMPIENEKYDARIFGIVIGEEEDRYYYCMLNKGEDVSSEVYRNKGLSGIEKTGEVKGRGFELIDAFKECIENEG